VVVVGHGGGLAAHGAKDGHVALAQEGEDVQLELVRQLREHRRRFLAATSHDRRHDDNAIIVVHELALVVTAPP
jgi:hypothetical protein